MNKSQLLLVVVVVMMVMVVVYFLSGVSKHLKIPVVIWFKNNNKKKIM